MERCRSVYIRGSAGRCRSMGRCRFSMVMWSAMIDNHRRRRSRSVFNDNNRCRSGYWCRCYYHRRRLYRSRHRVIGIRRPRRWYRAHAASTPNPGSVIPVPIPVAGNPGAFPPVISIFRNYCCRSRWGRRWRWRRNNISLFRRKKYIIQITEKSVYPDLIGSVINMTSGVVRANTGASGKEAPGGGEHHQF